MNVAAGLLTVVAFALAAVLIARATERTHLGIWHPAIAWLGLLLVFFGIGSVLLAIDGRPGPALYVAGAAALFGAAVWASDELARRRASLPPVVAKPAPPPHDPTPVRPVMVAGLVAIGVIAIAPTLLRVGIPFLVTDITGARSEAIGLPIQLLRVALPGAVVVAVLAAMRRARRGWYALAVAIVAVVLAFDIALASRYLAAEVVAALVIAAGLAGARFPKRAVAAIVVAGVLIFAGIQVLRTYDQAAGREVAFAVERTVNRLFLIQPRTLEALQAEIPAEQPWFGGLTWLRRLGPVFGRPDIPNLGYWIYPRLFPDQNPPGYAAPGLLGEAWANFGPAGLLLFAALGVFVERLGALLARRRSGKADIAAGALLTLFVARTHALGLNGLAVLVLLVIVWRLLVARPAVLMSDATETLRWRT